MEKRRQHIIEATMTPFISTESSRAMVFRGLFQGLNVFRGSWRNAILCGPTAPSKVPSFYVAGLANFVHDPSKMTTH